MQPDVIRDLGGGLVLRRSTPDDADKMADFRAEIQRDPGAQEPEIHVAAWTRDLLTRLHPTFDPGDFTVVEDTRTGAIVSAVCLIAQTWTYEGIPFKGGRLMGIETIQPLPKDWGHAAFPDRTFLQILFGYRSLQELRTSFADCWASGDEPRALLEVLFPKRTSHVWPIA